MADVVILMGSGSDEPLAREIQKYLNTLGLTSVLHVASAHKVPLKVLDILQRYGDEVVYITIAGRSNALSGFVDAHTAAPVIACPPYSDRFGGADIFSTLRMPSGVAPLTVLEPEAAALAAAKILGVRNPDIRRRVADYQAMHRQKVEEADRRLQESG